MIHHCKVHPWYRELPDLDISYVLLAELGSGGHGAGSAHTVGGLAAVLTPNAFIVREIWGSVSSIAICTCRIHISDQNTQRPPSEVMCCASLSQVTALAVSPIDSCEAPRLPAGGGQQPTSAAEIHTAPPPSPSHAVYPARFLSHVTHALLSFTVCRVPKPLG